MNKQSAGPQTPATIFLRDRNVIFSDYLYSYEEHGGTKVSSLSLGVSEHSVIKTLIMQDESAKPLIVLMHGDRKVSTKELARQIGCKKVESCKPEIAQKHSGYLVGGTSPFGTRKAMPIFLEKSVLDLPAIYINGGRRGYLVRLEPKELARVLDIKLVEVALSA